jgi:hypothetical protein
MKLFIVLIISVISAEVVHYHYHYDQNRSLEEEEDYSGLGSFSLQTNCNICRTYREKCPSYCRRLGKKDSKDSKDKKPKDSKKDKKDKDSKDKKPKDSKKVQDAWKTCAIGCQQIGNKIDRKQCINQCRATN